MELCLSTDNPYISQKHDLLPPVYSVVPEIRRLQTAPAGAGGCRDFIARVSNAERAQAILKPAP